MPGRFVQNATFSCYGTRRLRRILKFIQCTQCILSDSWCVHTAHASPKIRITRTLFIRPFDFVNDLRAAPFAGAAIVPLFHSSANAPYCHEGCGGGTFWSSPVWGLGRSFSRGLYLFLCWQGPEGVRSSSLLCELYKAFGWMQTPPYFACARHPPSIIFMTETPRQRIRCHQRLSSAPDGS